MSLVDEFRQYEEWVQPTGPDEIGLKGSPKAVWLASDLHIGHVSCDISKLKRHASYARQLGAWVFCLGDLCESVTTGSKVAAAGAHFEQWNPKKGGSINAQLNYVLKLLEPLDVKIVLDGNHERRLARQGFDVSQEIAERLGAKYLSPFASISFGKTKLLAHHGEGPAKFFDYARRDHPGHDVLSAGHNHHLSAEAVLEGKHKIVHCLRTGSYLFMPRYQMERATTHPNVPTGSFMLHFDKGQVSRIEMMT